jgi:hypothetical protein
MGADFMFSRFPRFEMTPERENELEDTLQDILSDPNEEVEFMDHFMYDSEECSAFQEVLGALHLINETADNDREAVAVRDFTEGGFAYVHLPMFITLEECLGVMSLQKSILTSILQDFFLKFMN